MAATFKISVASVLKWSQRFRATWSAAARPVGRNRPYGLACERDRLLRFADAAKLGSQTARDVFEAFTPSNITAKPTDEPPLDFLRGLISMGKLDDARPRATADEGRRNDHHRRSRHQDKGVKSLGGRPAATCNLTLKGEKIA